MASTDNTTGQQAETAANYVFLSGDAQPLNGVGGERRFFAVHPSRTAPRCRDCRHQFKDKVYAYCDHPAMPVQPDTGVIYVRTETARADPSAARCGPEGALFEPLDQPVR